MVGNALHMPKEQPWLKYADWAKQYGETYLAASQRLIKISSRRYYACSGIQSTHGHSEQLRGRKQTHVSSKMFQQIASRYAQ